MCRKFTPDELNKMSHENKNDVIYQMQERLNKLEQNYENLMEPAAFWETHRKTGGHSRSAIFL